LSGSAYLQFLGFDFAGRRIVVEESVDDGPDRGLDVVRTAVAQVIVLVGCLDHGDAGLEAHFVVRDDAGVEDGVPGTERKNPEIAVGNKGNAQIVERHDLLDEVGMPLGEIHRDVAAIGMPHQRQMAVIRV
jgi:hypothetical protein